MKMLRVDTEEELSITSAETQPHNKKRKPAGFVIKPLPVYNQSLLDDHRAEKVARARVDTEESQLAINGRQKRTRYATAMLQNGEESAVRGQREQEMWERAALQNLFGIDTEEDELKEIKVSGQEMKMLKMESVAMTVLMMSGKYGHKFAVEERCTGEEEEEEEEEEKEEEEEEEGDESGSSGEDTVVFDTERSNEEESEYSGEECNEDEE
ncbi:hypothetical protein F444_00557 [Phytophthora nicotianae P1976]|uniref:Uncharacterized protein n=1 Tax=Phytophthora nicotianae P1976 TaxID=1317066 RepID=A0A081B3W2_PHYNI|nr:hypothetical protein F444_00557 [Phytophthora nicotianae P1976]